MYNFIFNVKKCTLYSIKYGIYTSDFKVRFCIKLAHFREQKFVVC